MSRNRAGTCAMCGRPLGLYDSKWVERKPNPDADPRIVCADDVPRGCGARDIYDELVHDPRGERWAYYTDG